MDARAIVAGKRVTRLAPLLCAAAVASLLALAAPAFASPPANDQFAAAIDYGQSGTQVGGNIDASREPGEPQNGDATVWWKWTASKTARFRLDDCASVPVFTSTIGVYTGNSVSSLTELAINRNSGGCDDSTMESVFFDAVAGTTYHFSAGSYSNSESSNIRLSLRRTDPNDNFDSATAFDPVPGTMVGTNNDATRETGEPSTGERTVWWRWTATETARYRIDDCLSVPEFASVLGVYTGASVSSLVEVTRNSNGSGCADSNMEEVSFDAVAGTTYRFSVGSYSNTPSSNIRLSLRRTAVNDNFATALPFGNVPGAVTGTNVEATREDGEPENGDRTVWWNWTAPETDDYTLSPCQSDPPFSIVLAVYVGNAVTSLQEVPTTEGVSCSSASGMYFFAFHAVAGVTYYFSVGSRSAGSANIRLSLDHTIYESCVTARTELANAQRALAAAKTKTARAQASLAKANRALRKARKRSRAQIRRAKAKVASAKRGLKSARAKQAKANARLARAIKAAAAEC